MRSPKTEHGIVERARIVLLAAQGRSTRSIAAELGTWPGPRPGAAPHYTVATGKRILALLDQRPPAGFGRWTAPLLSRELVTCRTSTSCAFCAKTRSIWRRAGRGARPTIRTLVAKAAEIVGLYLDLPQDDIVLAVDDGPHAKMMGFVQ